jgi:hypothetical protein
VDVLTILGQLAETSADPRIRTLVKSLTSTQAGVNLSALTGGGAMRVEALEPELATATISNPHFVLFNLLFPNRHTSWSLIDQQVVQDGIGGYPGSAISNETGSNLNQRNGAYHRVITELKVLAEFGGVSVPTAMQGALQQAAGAADFNSAEQEIFSALSRVLQTAEWELLFGDPTMSPLEFQGLIPGITANAPNNVLNLNGIALNTGSQVAPLAARISGFGNWGSPDALICSPAVKADFDGHLESGYRVNLDSAIPNTTLGALVKSIKYNGLGIGNGVLDLYPHVFLDENMRQPVENYAATEVSGNAPASMAAVASGTSATIPAGTYSYRVEAAGPGFVSPTTLLTGSTVAVTLGQQVALTITQSSGAAESYYNVYRSSKSSSGSTVSSQMRFIGRIAKAGTTTVFTDTNASIPGTSQALMLTSAPQFDALRLVQMAPPSKIPLAMTSLQYQFAVMYLACLRLSLPKKHALITNILPSNAVWVP